MRALFFVGVLATSFAGFVACSSEESNPTPPSSFKVDSGIADTALATDAEVDTAPPPDTAGCVGDAGCFSCRPTSSEQFLNHCSGSQCSRFDDKTRIPSSVWDGGALPPVP